MVIDKSVCIGSSNCMEAAPDAYEVGERGIAVLVRPVRSPGAPSAQASNHVLLRGARACPVDAISVFDGAGQRLHP